MIRYVALRHARRFLTLHLAKQLPHRLRPQDLPQLFVVLRDMTPDRSQHRRIGHVDPAAHRHLLIGYRAVESAAAVPRPAAAGETRRDMILVRRLILTESRIAIDAIDRLVRIADVLRREALQLSVECDHQLPHWLLQFYVEDGLARLKPLAPV